MSVINAPVTVEKGYLSSPENTKIGKQGDALSRQKAFSVNRSPKVNTHVFSMTIDLHPDYTFQETLDFPNPREVLTFLSEV